MNVRPRPLLKNLYAAVDRCPEDATTLRELGDALAVRRQYTASMKYLLKAATTGPDRPEVLYSLAKAYRATNDYVRSVRYFESAVALNPEIPQWRQDLGYDYLKVNEVELAERQFRRAIELAPADEFNHFGLGTCWVSSRSLEEAIAWADAQVHIFPDRIKTYHGIAYGLGHFGRYGEARRCYELILELEPNQRLALLGLGHVAFVCRDFAESRRWHERALQFHSEYWLVHYFDYFSRCMTGDISGARLIYQEWRDCIRRFLRFDRRIYSDVEWVGDSLEGKTILVRADLGLGDTIQAARFLAALKDRGATVILEVPEPVRTLAETLKSVDVVIVVGDDCPPFDCEVLIDELWMVLGVELGALGGPVPYLHAPAQAVDAWRRRIALTEALKIGVVWRGRPLRPEDKFFNRSMPAGCLVPLSQIPGVSLYSFQLERAGAEEDDSILPVVDLAPDLQTFTDTAAAMFAMDLIVTIDTSVAHLAGALGRPAIVMLPYVPFAPVWPVSKSTSPWYPTMELFWQTTPGDWTELVERVCRDVRARVAGMPRTALA